MSDSYDKNGVAQPSDEERNEAAEIEAEVARELELTDEELVALCKARVCVGCNEKGEADEARLRALAEMDNYKKRLANEQVELRKYAAEKVLHSMLPILDNLDLALEHGRKMDACKDLVLGVDMTRKLFVDALAANGLTPVGQVGEPFDPARHEAMGHDDASDQPADHVSAVLQQGYLYHERLLRPAKVMISKADA